MPNRSANRLLLGVLVSIGSLTCLAPKTSGQDAAAETIVAGLHDPRGLAVQPSAGAEPHQLIVAESGARRIVRVQTGDSQPPAELITGFPAESPPVALLFLDNRRLIVACGDSPAVRLFELASTAEPQPASAATQQSPEGELQSAMALARTRPNDQVADALVLIGRQRDKRDWLGRLPVRAGTLGEPAAYKTVDIANPSAIAVSSQGFILVSDQPEKTGDRSSRLTFINPMDGFAVMQLPVELAQISALAYSPKTGDLFAAASAAGDDRTPGVFRIDSTLAAGKPACKAQRIARVARPAALAIAADGTLYVTSAGTIAGEAGEDQAAAKGALVKLTGTW